MTIVDLGVLDNRCPRPGLRCDNRIDPFWDRLWAGGSQSSWMARSTLDRLAEAGVARVRKQNVAYSPAEARSIMLDQSSTNASLRAEGLAALGALHQHRTLSSEQVASLTGIVKQRTGRNTMGRGGLGLGFATGLIERGRFLLSAGVEVAGTLPDVWRPARVAKAGWLVDELSYEEWVAVTGRQGLTFGSQFDRHNLSNAEFLLRAAEFSPMVAAVTGEAMAHVATMANVADAGRAGAYADGALVRSDGLRVAVESQNNAAKPVLVQKVKRWVDRLAATTSLDEGGLVVMFLDVVDPDRGRVVENAVRQVIAEVLDDYPWTVRYQIDQRIFMSRWVDFFPAPGKVDGDRFPVLRALRPTGTRASRWEPVDLMDPASLVFNPSNRDDWTATNTYLAGLHGCPFWLRDEAEKIDWERVLFDHWVRTPELRAQYGAYHGYDHNGAAKGRRAS